MTKAEVEMILKRRCSLRDRKAYSGKNYAVKHLTLPGALAVMIVSLRESEK